MIKTIESQLVYPTTSKLGEGAWWDDIEQKLYWIDILQNKVYCYNPINKSNTGWDVGEPVGTIVLCKKGDALLGLKNGLARLNLDTGAIQHLVDPEKDKPNNRFNDGKCDPQGRFWVGSIGNDGTENTAALYCYESNGHIEVKIPNVTISNGLVWSRNQKTFYYIDSITQSIHAYDYDPTSGSIANQKTIVTFDLQKEGVPDGMAIDEQDNLWVAMFGGSSVICVDSSSYQKIHSVTLPVTNVTSCAFGGPDLNELYITTATVALSDQQLEQQPLAGSLFKAKVPYKGRPAFRFSS